MSGTGSDTAWTREQEEAITTRDENLLVSAAAGAGKTAVLVERVIRRILDPAGRIDVDELLVVTFTEAAASEMRERIGEALDKAVAAAPDDENLSRQRMLVGRASISTLHAFCLHLVRRYFYRLGLDPGLAVMSEHEAHLLRAEVLEALFTRRLDEEAGDGGEGGSAGEGASPFRELADRYGGGGTNERLKYLLLGLHDWVRSLPWPDDWLDRAVARFDVPPDSSIEKLEIWAPLCGIAAAKLGRAREALRRAAGIARSPGGPESYLERLADDLARVEGGLAAARPEGSWDALSGAIKETIFGKLKSAAGVTEELRRAAKDLRDEAKEIVAKLKALFDRPSREAVDDLRRLAPPMATLAALVRDFDQAFAAEKRRLGVMDFNDLERFALDLLRDPAAPPGELRPSEVARELRARYEEVLVDEYQDVNGVQDAILALVSRDGADGLSNRFLVGDVKQSIYRFRQTDPTLFQKKYADYRTGEGGRLVVLGKNFRSREGIVEAVNGLFGKILTRRVGEIEYDEAARLVAGADYPPLPGGPPVEVHLVERTAGAATGAGDGEDGGEEGGRNAEGGEDGGDERSLVEDYEAAEREAAIIARRIRELMEGSPGGGPPLPVWDSERKAYRPLGYRDVVVLLRATKKRANDFVDVLLRAGIPAYAELGTGYFAAIEVQSLLALLKILDNPRQDIPLATVLGTPLAGFGEGLPAADLARVRLAAPRGSFWEAVSRAARGPGGAVDVALASRMAEFAGRITRWRAAARRGALSTLVWRIYEETGYLHIVGGIPGGEQRRANLLALYERARQFDNFARQGLFRFLRFIDGLLEEGADLGTAPVEGAAEDVVRILSIHKAKGLEFPVVFVADLGKKFNQQDLQGDLVVQREFGFGPWVIDPAGGVKHASLAHSVVRETARLECLAEEMRILYVALTRAREKLVLVGSAKNLVPEKCGAWAEAAAPGDGPLPEAVLSGAVTYLDWIGPAIASYPDGEPIRAASATSSSGATPAPAVWDVRLWSTSAQEEVLASIRAAGAAAPALDWKRLARLDPLPERASAGEEPSAVRRELAERLSWQYAYAGATGKPAKRPATEIKRLLGGEPEPDPEAAPFDREAPSDRLESRPRFLQAAPSRLTPAEKGTANHLVLERLDLTALLDAADVERQIGAMVGKLLLTPEQAQAIDPGAIARFFRSELGARLRAAPDRVRRELPFTLGVAAGEVYPELAGGPAADDVVVVQGIIDVLLETDDGAGFVLIDFKTGSGGGPGAASAAERYRSQIALYRRAAETILSRPVPDAYLFFLESGETVRL